MPPLTAAQIQAHPNFSKVIWNLKPDQKGRCKVAQNRGGAFELAYQVHGHGPAHIVVGHDTIELHGFAIPRSHAQVK